MWSMIIMDSITSFIYHEQSLFETHFETWTVPFLNSFWTMKRRFFTMLIYRYINMLLFNFNKLADFRECVIRNICVKHGFRLILLRHPVVIRYKNSTFILNLKSVHIEYRNQAFKIKRTKVHWAFPFQKSFCKVLNASM